MIASTESLRVTFRPEPRQQLQDMRPGKVAVLVTNEYEGIFRNGGIGTYYRQLSEALAAGGWRVLLLLTRTERRFAGHSTFPAVKHIFSTAELEEVLDLQPVHRAMLSARRQDPYALESIGCLLLVRAVVEHLVDQPIYIEFPEIMGAGYHSIHAARAGLLGPGTVTAVTMHGCHEWVCEASEQYSHEYPAGWFWQASYLDSFSFENADLSFYPSHFLRAKVESFGWNTSRAIHLPYFVPRVEPDGRGDDGVPAIDPAKQPVVFFGRLEERKGLCTFVDALHALPPAVRRGVHALFLGKVVRLSSPSLAHLESREYLEQALPADVSHNIVTDLSSARALGYVRALRHPIVCLASPQENFPNSSLEMGQMPSRLVVSDTGGFRETLDLVERTAGVYWFEPRNALALSAVLQRAIAGPDKAPATSSPEDIARINRALLDRKEALIQRALARPAPLPPPGPRLTVAVLWRGEAATLRDCLAGLDAQGGPDLDVLVMDIEEAAHEHIRHARTLFPRFRFVRPPNALTAGAAWNQAVALAEGTYFLGVESGMVLAPFAVSELLRAAAHGHAAILCWPARARATGEELPGFSGGPLSRLMEAARHGPPPFVATVELLRRFPRLEETDALPQGWEILAGALVTGALITYYPFPLSEVALAPPLRDDAATLKLQYQLRQYVAQIPAREWDRRQLALLLMATQQLQAQVAAPRPVLASTASHPFADLARLEQQSADAAQLHAELLEGHRQRQMLEQTRLDLDLARGRIAAMESSKFWKLRRAWFQLKRAVGAAGTE